MTDKTVSETLYILTLLNRSASGDHPLDTILDLLELALADDEGGDGRPEGHARIVALADRLRCAGSPAGTLDGLRMLAAAHADLEPGDWEFGDGSPFDVRACLRWAVSEIERSVKADGELVEALARQPAGTVIVGEPASVQAARLLDDYMHGMHVVREAHARAVERAEQAEQALALASEAHALILEVAAAGDLGLLDLDTIKRIAGGMSAMGDEEVDEHDKVAPRGGS